MGRIFLTGDVHFDVDIGKLSKKKFPVQSELTKDDYLIILGDFGMIWYNDENTDLEAYWREVQTNRKYTTVVVLGNHENYNRIEKLPEVEMFGGVVWKYTDSIFILKRGAVYTIADKTFFTMGGAMSTDKENNPHRMPNVGWWEQEIPSHREFENGYDALEGCGYKVDYVITHTTPTMVINQYMNKCRQTYINEFKQDNTISPELYDRVADEYVDKEYFESRKDIVSHYFTDLILDKNIQFKRWFFGHFHDNWTTNDGKFTMLYNHIIELEDDGEDQES